MTLSRRLAHLESAAGAADERWFAAWEDLFAQAARAVPRAALDHLLDTTVSPAAKLEVDDLINTRAAALGLNADPWAGWVQHLEPGFTQGGERDLAAWPHLLPPPPPEPAGIREVLEREVMAAGLKGLAAAWLLLWLAMAHEVRAGQEVGL